MIQASDAFKNAYSSGSPILAKVKITFADGGAITIEDDEILEGGLVIETATSQPEAFEIGNIVIGKLTLAFFNEDGKYNNYDFRGAIIKPYVGVEISNGTVEYIQKGLFYADRPTISSNAVSIVAYDNTSKLDREYGLSIAFPEHAKQIFIKICNACEIAYYDDFPNSSVIISQLPDTKELTYRALLSYIAQITGNFGVCDNEGNFKLTWYDVDLLRAGTQTQYTNSIYENYALNVFTQGNIVEGDSIEDFTSQAEYDSFYEWLKTKSFADVYSATVDMWDIQVTGVRVYSTKTVVDDDENEELVDASYLAGTEGYVLEIAENPCISADDIEAVARRLLARCSGYLFRPSTVSINSNPMIEAGDAITISDSNGLTCNAIVTNCTYTHRGSDSYSCGAENANERLSKRTALKNLENDDLKGKIIEAKNTASNAQKTADNANETVEEVQVELNNMTLYFYYDESGAHVCNDARNRTDVDASGMTVVKNGEDVAHFSESTRLGYENGTHAILDGNGFKIKNGVSTVYSIQYEGVTTSDNDYQTDFKILSISGTPQLQNTLIIDLNTSTSDVDSSLDTLTVKIGNGSVKTTLSENSYTIDNGRVSLEMTTEVWNFVKTYGTKSQITTVVNLYSFYIEGSYTSYIGSGKVNETITGNITPGDIKGIANLIYPVGSIYMSMNSANPGALFGGTWESLPSRFLIGADGGNFNPASSDNSKKYGGEYEHTLSEAELPVVQGQAQFRQMGTTNAVDTYRSGLSTSNHFIYTKNGGDSWGNVGGTTSNPSSTNKNATLKMSFGSGQAHNNMPPWLAVYMWQRTA